MPPPSQVVSLGVVTLPKTMFLSSISKVVVLSVTVVPLTVKSPLSTKLVPEATPMFGVINVGLLSTTNVDPVPVWLAIDVAFPVEVIGPVKFALVVTVAAFPVVDWLRVGKSPATAIDGTPVAVVFFNIPVASAARFCPLIATTVKAVAPVASPVWVAFDTKPEYKEFMALSPVLVPLIEPVEGTESVAVSAMVSVAPVAG